MSRHLHYRVFPVRANGVWQWNLTHLLKRIDLFDGRRVCAIGLSEGPRAKFPMDPPEAVEEILRPHGFEFLRSRNDRTLRETKTFVPALDMIRPHAAEGDSIFFAHTKGVGRDMTDERKPVRIWTRLMYELNLDYWPVVERVLFVHPAAGAFKKSLKAFRESRSLWHYSGTFFWLRAADLFARDWRRIDEFMWGTEAYPGLHYTDAEGGVICSQCSWGTDLNLYDPKTMLKIEREVHGWKLRHTTDRTASTSLTDLSLT